MSLPDVIMPEVPPDNLESSPREEKTSEPAGASQVRSEPVNYDESAPAPPAQHMDKVETMIGEMTTPPPPPAPEPPPPMKVKAVLEDEAVFKDVKPKKAKSQKQLDHLAKAREKALLVRQANAEAKKQSKFAEQATKQDPRPKENKESVILHMSVSEFQKLQKQSNLDAVESYDTKRKAQKKAKREAQEEYTKANKVNQQINKALGVADQDDMWSVCFQ